MQRSIPIFPSLVMTAVAFAVPLSLTLGQASALAERQRRLPPLRERRGREGPLADGGAGPDDAECGWHLDLLHLQRLRALHPIRAEPAGAPAGLVALEGRRPRVPGAPGPCDG